MLLTKLQSEQQLVAFVITTVCAVPGVCFAKAAAAIKVVHTVVGHALLQGLDKAALGRMLKLLRRPQAPYCRLDVFEGYHAYRALRILSMATTLLSTEQPNKQLWVQPLVAPPPQWPSPPPGTAAGPAVTGPKGSTVAGDAGSSSSSSSSKASNNQQASSRQQAPAASSGSKGTPSSGVAAAKDAAKEQQTPSTAASTVPPKPAAITLQAYLQSVQDTPQPAPIKPPAAPAGAGAAAAAATHKHGNPAQKPLDKAAIDDGVIESAWWGPAGHQVHVGAGTAVNSAAGVVITQLEQHGAVEIVAAHSRAITKAWEVGVTSLTAAVLPVVTC